MSAAQQTKEAPTPARVPAAAVLSESDNMASMGCCLQN